MRFLEDLRIIALSNTLDTESYFPFPVILTLKLTSEFGFQGFYRNQN